MAKGKRESVDFGDMDMVGTMSIADSVGPTLGFWQRSGKEIPHYATEFAAGFDIRADLAIKDQVDYYDHTNIKHERTVRDAAGTGRLYIEPGDRVLVPTGLFADIPQYCYIAIHPRSGMSWKQGLILTNGVGVVDSDYVEEIKVSLTNISGSRIYIEDGDRIAQGLLMPVTRAEMGALSGKPAQKTSRVGGFGSTGDK